ncbi:hypothetical protein D3C87_1738200 [compost metagenome]
MPYKRYESNSMEQVLTEPEASVSVCAETSTLRRWKSWFQVLAVYFMLALQALSARFPGVASLLREPSFTPSVVSTETFRHEGPGWLARLVRPIANAQLWVHTRFAYLSAPPLR